MPKKGLDRSVLRRVRLDLRHASDHIREVQPETGVEYLSRVANERPVPAKLQSRLVELRNLFADDVDAIESELGRAVLNGLPDATSAASHLLSAGGKRIRPLCALLASRLFGQDVTSAAAREVAIISELVHLATLLHDDVIDDGLERRGKPTARTLWGNGVSVLAGDLLLTHSLERASKLAPAEVLSDLFRTLRMLVDGEIVQLRGRVNFDDREETYTTIVDGKTASLFAWASSSAARVVGATPEQCEILGTFGGKLGKAFQMVDDVVDYEGEQSGKLLFADLNEGKVTLPVLRVLQKEPTLRADVDRVRAGSNAETGEFTDAQRVSIERVIAAVRKHRISDEIRAEAETMIRGATALLEKLPASPSRDLLGFVAFELCTRSN